MTLVRKSGSSVVIWIKSLATEVQRSFCSGSRSHRRNFAMTPFMPRSCFKISDPVVFGMPRSASSARAHCQSLVVVDCSPYMFIILRCSYCSPPEYRALSTGSWLSWKHLFHFHLHCIPCIALEILLNHLNSFCGIIICTLNTKFNADSLLYLLSHFECHNHTVHMLTQWHLLPPPTSTVKASLFTHALFSPHSLAARLHRYPTNRSCYINNGWIFSR